MVIKNEQAWTYESTYLKRRDLNFMYVGTQDLSIMDPDAKHEILPLPS